MSVSETYTTYKKSDKLRSHKKCINSLIMELSYRIYDVDCKEIRFH